MKCPKCKQVMRKVGWHITNNGKSGAQFKEYDRYTYRCEADDIWVTTETPTDDKSKKSTSA